MSSIDAMPKKAMRCVNIVNFIRGVEPRFETDLLLPVRKQMEIIVAKGLPATWLLQFDALVSGPFVAYLREHMPKGHEVGTWFEMNEMHCNAAGVAWRGRPGYEWDHYPSVAFTLGYTKDERTKLADAAMGEFKRVWGMHPSSVASWNLDAFTVEYLAEKYGVDAFATCRDQIATDGFTIWGSPIAGYYPSKTNLWSPAVDSKNQIKAPVFRMLGQDPVYYYDKAWPMPDGKMHGEPDTMEPVWPSGRSPEFVKRFLSMIESSPTLGFANAQLGQENSFPWRDQEPGYAPQIAALAELAKRGAVSVETMGESGRRFKKAFAHTPPQAQIMLDDPFGNREPECRTVWFQSRFYRANLHFRGDVPYLRDLVVYRDAFRQPFLDEPTRANDVEQRLLAVIDGYHWSKSPGSSSQPRAGAYFYLGERLVRVAGKPQVKESGDRLEVSVDLEGGGSLLVRFDARTITLAVTGSEEAFAVALECEVGKATLASAADGQIKSRWQGFDYSVPVSGGSVKGTKSGWKATASNGKLTFDLSH